jgi:hypothetical protein
MWTVIYIAPNKQAAEELRDALGQEGVLVSLRTTGFQGATGNAHVELLVPKGEAREAQEILHQTLGRLRR